MRSRTASSEPQGRSSRVSSSLSRLFIADTTLFGILRWGCSAAGALGLPELRADNPKSESRHLAEAIEAADRKIKDYLLRLHLSLWHPISTAPANHDLELKLLDGASTIILPFPCRRTNAGEWINADLETSINIR